MSPETDRPLPGAMDEAEPTAQTAVVPVLLIGLFGLLFYWGMVFVDDHGGGFNPQVYPAYASLNALQDLQPVLSGPDPRVGQRVFNTICSVCHQANGLGLPGQFPPLAGSEWVNAEGPNRIIRIVLNGLHGPIQVKGQSLDNTMLSWKDTLKDEEIASVLTWVRQNKDWGNNAPPVTAEQVKAIRAQVADRNDNWTPEELMKIPEKD